MLDKKWHSEYWPSLGEWVQVQQNSHEHSWVCCTDIAFSYSVLQIDPCVLVSDLTSTVIFAYNLMLYIWLEDLSVLARQPYNFTSSF